MSCDLARLQKNANGRDLASQKKMEQSIDLASQKEMETSCELCIQKKVLSWYWAVLKRRLPPGHRLFEDGDRLCRLSAKYLPLDVVVEEKELVDSSLQAEQFPCGYAKCCMVFDSLLKYESHYGMAHRHVCSTCSRVFPSAHLLDVHVLETHDSLFPLLAEKNNMYQCLLEDCEARMGTSEERRDHMIKQHRFPANYRYDRQGGKRSKKSRQKIVESVDNRMETENFCDNKESSLPQNQSSGRVFSYKVPQNISFGQGVPRGFMGSGRGGRGRAHGQGGGRGRKGRGKHWHNMDSGTGEAAAINIETVDMGELAEALT